MWPTMLAVRMSEYPLARGAYYGVNYGGRGRKECPLDEVPSQFLPPYCRAPKDRDPQMPDYAPNDLSLLCEHSRAYVSTCALAVRKDFFGGYDYKARAGLIHYANHHISPGKKQWTWGNHRIWLRLGPQSHRPRP